MVVEKPELLKEWLIATLQKMCNADPVALGRYILALVKKDKPDLKSFLLEQLEIFLLQNTTKFVELLIETLSTKSYIRITSDPIDGSKLVKEENRDKSTTVHQPTTSTALDSSSTRFFKHKKELKLTNDSIVASHKTSAEKQSIIKQKSDSKRMEIPITIEPYKPTCLNDSCSKQEYVPTACKRVFQEIASVPNSKKPKYCDNTPSDINGKADNLPIPNLGNSSAKNENFSKSSKRCKDFDEKGYCLRGDSCHFDHGKNPIQIEKSPEEYISNMKFNNKSDKYEKTDSTFPPLPTSPPKISPPPPPPEDIHEPYNPESPGMNLPLNFLNRSKLLYQPVSRPSSVASRLYSENFDLFSKAKQGRHRELINVASTNNLCDSNQVADDKSCLKPLTNVIGNFCTSSNEAVNYIPPQPDVKPKRFDFTRLGSSSRTTLEIRKIPRAQNTIQNLHQHFSKFGTITNIEISYDNDPEAAIVSFSSNYEATAAYRSTDAILQNRFIKVFWNSQNYPQKRKLNSNLKEIPFRSFTSTSNVEKNGFLSSNAESNNGETSGEKVIDDPENPLLLKGNPRPAYDLRRIHALKKVFPKLTTTQKRFCGREGNIVAHKIKLHQARNELLNNTIKHQKKILDQLLKTTKKNEKMFLKKTLIAISKQVEELTNDLKKENDELRTILKITPHGTKSKIAANELLNVEFELYKKQNSYSAEDSTEILQKKVDFMKNKAKALGLIDSSSRVTAKFLRTFATPRNSSLSIDHRTKKIFISGETLVENENLKEHFMQFGNIENIEENSVGVIMAFCTRTEAEAAYSYGTKYENKYLNISWYNDTKMNVDDTTDSDEREQNMMEDSFEDEDEREVRPWRH